MDHHKQDFSHKKHSHNHSNDSHSKNSHSDKSHSIPSICIDLVRTRSCHSKPGDCSHDHNEQKATHIREKIVKTQTAKPWM